MNIIIQLPLLTIRRGSPYLQRKGVKSLRPESLEFTFEQIANSLNALLLGVRPYNLFVDNKATDQLGGYSYECVLPSNKYERIVVKVPSLPPVIKNDEIDGEIFITFSGFAGRFYKDRGGNYQLSCKAIQAHIE